MPLPAILMVDDDAEDRFLAEKALRKIGYDRPLNVVEDGVQLMDYLHGRGEYDDRTRHPMPEVILLDLNMPRMDGFAALREIRSMPGLMSTPVVVLTTTGEKHDVDHCYRLGASACVTKPAEFRELVSIMSELARRWFGNNNPEGEAT